MIDRLTSLSSRLLPSSAGSSLAEPRRSGAKEPPPTLTAGQPWATGRGSRGSARATCAARVLECE